MTRLWDREAPLEPIEGERPDQNNALRRYYMMGNDRSLRKLAKIYLEEHKNRKRGDISIPAVPTTSIHTLATWSADLDWVNRAMQKDMLDQAEIDKQWQERRQQVREDDWSHASQLRTLAQRILDAAPSFVKHTRKVVDEGTPRVLTLEGEVVKEGRPREIVVTVALSVSDLVRVEKSASRLARLAAEMDESRRTITVDWREEAERAGLSPSTVYSDLVAQLVSGIESGSGGATPSGGAEGGATPDEDVEI